MSVVELRNVTKKYGEGEATVYALNHVSLKVEKGECIAIMGTSGSGKSTLLNMIGTIDEPTQGEILIGQKNINAYSQKEKAEVRNRFFGFVMQDFALIPHYTVMKNIQLPLEYQYCPKKEKKEKVKEMLEQLHIADKMKAYPAQLSGGQKQRVAIARAIINEAEVLLCDEPTGALDSTTSEEIMTIFQKLNKEGKTIIIVTHDKKVASYCNRLIRIEDGKIVSDEKQQHAPASDLFPQL